MAFPTASEARAAYDFRRGYLHGLSNTKDRQKGDVSLAALDFPHVGTVDAGGIGQRFLRHA